MVASDGATKGQSQKPKALSTWPYQQILCHQIYFKKSLWYRYARLIHPYI